MKPSLVSRSRPQHLCIFGDAKTGKSTLAAGLLKSGYHLTWISMDNGHEVVFKMGLKDDYLDAHLNLIILPDTKEWPVAIKTCRKIVRGRNCHICDLHGEVDCVVCKRSGAATWSDIDVSTFGPRDIIVFDHLGQLANSAMTQVFKLDKKDPEDDKAEWDHYARQGFLMDGFLTNIQQAQYNVICITHVCEAEMEDGRKKLVPLVGTTNFSRNAPKYFDHVVYCHMLNRDHKFGSMTGYQNTVITGSRSDKDISKATVASAAMFFDGTAPVVKLAGAQAAEKVLTSAPKVTAVDTSKVAVAEQQREESALLAEKYEDEQLATHSDIPEEGTTNEIPAELPAAETEQVPTVVGTIEHNQLLEKQEATGTVVAGTNDLQPEGAKQVIPEPKSSSVDREALLAKLRGRR